MKEIEITIDLDGKVEIDQTGFHGKGCDKIAEALSKVIGKVVKQEKKCEYYQPEVEIKVKQKLN